MSRIHRVSQGESVTSLAEASGHFPGAIWSHPENEGLRARRSNMNILAEGDLVFIPDLQAKSVPAATGKLHTYRRRGVPAMFRLQLLRNGKPRKNVRYRLEVLGALITGVTDERGVLEAFVPPSAQEIRLFVGKSTTARVLRVGRLSPADSTSGVQQRLRNLGYDCAVSGAVDEATRAALRAFQRGAGLKVTGEPDADTLAAVQRAHDEVGGERS